MAGAQSVQPPIPVESAPAKPATAASKPIAEVPFDFFANKIYLPVMVNGHGPYPLAFDTGSPTPVLDSDLAAQLEIKPGMPMAIGGAGEGSMKGSISSDVKLSIGEGEGRLNFTGAATALIPINSKLGPSSGHTLMGLVGNNICTRYTVVIDYAAHIMRFYDAATYEYVPSEGREKGHEARIRVRGHTFLTVSVLPEAWGEKEPIKGSFILDTGARISVSLTTPFVDRHDLLNDQVPSILVAAGHGIGGVMKHHAARLASLSLADFTIERPVVFLSQDKSGVLASDDIAGIIGADILKKFTLILDYKRHRVIFEPNPSLAGPIDFDMSGLWLTAEGENHQTLTISDVADGSPAAAAGLKAGDVIVSIDGRSAAESDYEKLVELFRQEGRTIKLRVKSGEAERDVELVFKRRV